MDELRVPDPDKFVFDFPVFFVAFHKKGQQKQKGLISLDDPNVVMVTNKRLSKPREKCVPVFTDKAAAQEFSEGLRITRPILVSLESPHHLADALLIAAQRGFKRVSFDQRPGRPSTRSYSIDEVIDAIRPKPGSGPESGSYRL